MIFSTLTSILWFVIAGLFLFNLHFNLRHKKFKHRKAIHFGTVGFFALAMLFFTAQSFGFHSHAVRVTGVVKRVSYYNSECRADDSYFMRKFECTKFQDFIEYQDNKGTVYSVVWEENEIEGHEAPMDKALRKVGDEVDLVYAAHNPAQVYPDSFGLTWFNPLAVAGFIAVSMAAYFVFRPRMRKI